MQQTTTTARMVAARAAHALFALAAAAAAALAVHDACAQQVADGTLAAAIRASGHACAHVVESQATGGSGSSFRVRCNSGSYQVTVNDDGSAEVTPLD